MGLAPPTPPQTGLHSLCMALGPWTDDGHMVGMTRRTQTLMGVTIPFPLFGVLERGGKALRRMVDPTGSMPLPDAGWQG